MTILLWFDWTGFKTLFVTDFHYIPAIEASMDLLTCIRLLIPMWSTPPKWRLCELHGQLLHCRCVQVTIFIALLLIMSPQLDDAQAFCHSIPWWIHSTNSCEMQFWWQELSLHTIWGILFIICFKVHKDSASQSIVTDSLRGWWK